MGQKVSQALDDPSNEEKLKSVFKTLDKDGSNALGKNEWVKFAEEIKKNPAVYGFPPMKDKKAFIDKAFAEADTDNNGMFYSRAIL